MRGMSAFFFVADWHALTTDYAAPADLSAGAVQMVRLWLAAGLEPSRVVMFRQSEGPGARGIVCFAGDDLPFAVVIAFAHL